MKNAKNLPIQAAEFDINGFNSTISESRALSLQYAQRGKGLINEIRNNGISPEVLDEARLFIVECRREVARMAEERKVFTRPVNELLAAVIAAENALRDDKPETEAAILRGLIEEYYDGRLRERRLKHAVAEEAYAEAQYALQRRSRLGAAKREKIRADIERSHIGALAQIPDAECATEIEVQCETTDAVMKVFALWYEDKGRYMDVESLQGKFPYAFTYARREAAKGHRIIGEGVEYVERAKV